MRHAAALPEKLLARVAVVLVLANGVLDRLLGEAVLQLERDDGQAVDEQNEVEREVSPAGAVTQLASYGEAVLGVQRSRRFVAGRRSGVEQVQAVLAVIDSVAENFNHAALADFGLQPRQELAARRVVRVERE